MRRAVVPGALIATLAAAGSVSAQPEPRSPRNANYTIAARLDPASRTISGTETIVWRNITATIATELQFHLYWNAWKNARTTFMRELALGGTTPARRRRDSDWSHIDVTGIKLTAPAQADLTSAQHFITPDEQSTGSASSREAK